MARDEWTELWEDDDKRYAAYSEASPEEKLQMRQEYSAYLERTYFVGSVATASAEILPIDENV